MMGAAVKCNILLYVCFFCLLQGYCFQIQDEKDDVYETFPEQNAIKRTKRGADWSKRISAAEAADIPKYEPAQSENVEIVSKPSRVVRRMRVHHPAVKDTGTVEENPQNRSTERTNKIVRIKKFKRKPTRKPTTVIPKTTPPSPVSTTTVTFTTTRKSLFKKPRIPTTVTPRLTSSSPYSHITVINKEIRNPKRNKNKKKKQKHHLVATYSYDTAEKHNGFLDMTEKPESYGYLEPQPRMRPLDEASFYSNNRGNYGKRDNFVQSINPKEVNREKGKNMQVASHKENDNNKAFDTTSEISHLPYGNQNQMYHPTYSRSVSVSRKVQSPSNAFMPYEREKDDLSQRDPSARENLRESSSSLDEIQGRLEKNKTDSRSEEGGKNESVVRVTVDRAGDSLSTTGASADYTISPLNKEVILNSDNVASSPAPELRIQNPNAGILTPIPNGVPSHFPSILYGGQNAFSDPFFNTPDIAMPFQRNRPHILPSVHPYSPFGAPDNSQGDSYLFRDEIQPYKSGEFMVPSFHPSSEITSLRRSILDAYGDDTTTSEPVTYFPKFEIPTIDFNDKGCKTVYKEVKTLPGDGVQSRNTNAKSVIMERECFFPNGIPTIKRTNGEDVISEVPAPDVSKKENFKSYSKE